MQPDLFAKTPQTITPEPALPLLPAQIRRWQQQLHDFQSPLFQGEPPHASQSDLFDTQQFESQSFNSAACFNPLQLTPLPMSFWRWPDSPHRGAAIYLVMDRPAELDQPLLLYIGETLAADRRWKGDHDCKRYLAAYGEALQRCGLAHQLSIRFCTDVPAITKERRALERRLIQRWQPPFNKETRQRWATPFTAEP